MFHDLYRKNPQAHPDRTIGAPGKGIGRHIRFYTNQFGASQRSTGSFSMGLSNNPTSGMGGIYRAKTTL
jgi:hypothetical protein